MTITDPWATAPEEAQQAPEAPQQTSNPVAGTVDVAVRPVIQAPVSEGKITLTFKGDGTYGSRWLVAHVANPAEGLELLGDPQFKELLDLSKRIASYDGAGSAQPAAPQSAPQRQLQPSQPAGSVEAPSWAPPKPYDDFVYVSKVSAKNGKTWHAWMAPGKDDPREPKFFYPPR